MRLSTWKQQDYSARLAANPEEWAAIVFPLAGAGVDAFHLSQRRYWEGEFGTEANLATWTKKLTGKPTITVGSITLDIRIPPAIVRLELCGVRVRIASERPSA